MGLWNYSDDAGSVSGFNEPNGSMAPKPCVADGQIDRVAVRLRLAILILGLDVNLRRDTAICGGRGSRADCCVRSIESV